VYSWLECKLEIKPKSECVTSNSNLNLIESGNSELKESLEESRALELKLDIDEPQELHTMCMQSSNRNYIAQLIAQLVTVHNRSSHYTDSKRKVKNKWSDIVAGKSPKISKPNSAATYNIETVITSRPSHPNKEICGAETNNTFQSLIARKEKKYYGDGRPKIIILGDSHAGGIAGELKHQSNHHLNTIGYVKPNAKFIDLILLIVNYVN